MRGIAFTRFLKEDVVRHPLVARIVAAYENHQTAKDAAERLMIDFKDINSCLLKAMANAAQLE